jgi:hypothetical protein
MVFSSNLANGNEGMLEVFSYYALISCTQKLKLIGKGGQVTYTSTLSLTCNSHRAQMWNRNQLLFIIMNRVR